MAQQTPSDFWEIVGSTSKLLCASCCLYLAKNVPLEKNILPNPDTAGGWNEGTGSDTRSHLRQVARASLGGLLGFGFPGDSDG